MKRCILSSVAAVGLVALLFASGTRAEARTKTRAGPDTALVTFRLQVSGQPASGTTFWVAYGPLDGHFGLIQLHASQSGLYTAQRRLPLHGRTIYSYLAGQGTAQTRIGRVPGDPVITIRTFGPLSLADQTLPLVRWQAPVG
jgi:hypothetical protein